MESHLEVLIISTVFLGIDVGDVEVEPIDQFQNAGHTTRNILQYKFYQYNAGIRGFVLEITDFFQLRICCTNLVFCAFNIQKQHMRIYSFVIAHAGNIDTQFSKTFAGFQKSTNMVGHRCCICLFHISIT